MCDEIWTYKCFLNFKNYGGQFEIFGRYINGDNIEKQTRNVRLVQNSHNIRQDIRAQQEDGHASIYSPTAPVSFVRTNDVDKRVFVVFE